MIKTSYDPEADAFAAWFAAEEVRSDRTEEVAPGVFVDLDAAGNAIGIKGAERAAPGLGRLFERD